MTTRDKIIKTMEKLLFNGKASANYNHVDNLAKKLKEYDDKHPMG